MEVFPKLTIQPCPFSYLTGSYQASFVIALSILTSNTAGQTKKMLTSGIIWFGACVSNISSPFFWKANQSPGYRLGIGSILVANCLETLMFVLFFVLLRRENHRRDARQAAKLASGEVDIDANETTFQDMTDIQNPNFRYVY